MPLELLEKFYELINELRQKGVKMKDIANYINLSSSVVSALYSTVLPTFINNKEKLGAEEALDYAISQVNNVSKKKLLITISDIYQRLLSLKPNQEYSPTDTFIATLDRFVKKVDNTIFNYLGIYNSYSLSSARDALKVEPFILSAGDSGEISVVRKNAYNTINTGVAIVANGHSMYILLNESNENQLALVTIYLQLPFYEKATFLRGLYITLDYNRNPIGRRILFVKKSNLTDSPELETMEGEILDKETLNDEMKAYYDYVSGTSDVIKMCSIPFPKFDLDDLIMEKMILSTKSYGH